MIVVILSCRQFYHSAGPTFYRTQTERAISRPELICEGQIIIYILFDSFYTACVRS